MRPNCRTPLRELHASPSASEWDDSSGDDEGSTISGPPYDPLTNYLSPRPKFLHYDPRRHCEVIARMKSLNDDEEKEDDDEEFSVNSKTDFSSSRRSDSSDESRNNAEEEEEKEEESCNAKWLFELILLILGFVGLSIACMYSMSNCSHSQLHSVVVGVRIGDWNQKSLSFTHEGVPQKNEKSRSETDWNRMDLNSWFVDDAWDADGGSEQNVNELKDEEIKDSSEEVDDCHDERAYSDENVGMEDDKTRDSLEEADDGHDERAHRDKIVRIQDGNEKRTEHEEPPGDVEQWAESELGEDLPDRKQTGTGTIFYLTKEKSDPRGREISETSEVEVMRMLEVKPFTGDGEIMPETIYTEAGGNIKHGQAVSKGTASSSSAVYIPFTAILASLLLILYLKRKKNIAKDPSTTVTSGESVEKLERSNWSIHDSGFSSSLMNTPPLGSFTTMEKISVKEEDGHGRAWKLVTTPVRRSSRICDRKIRSR